MGKEQNLSIKENSKIVCSEYGVGVVEKVYQDNIRGFDEDYVEINFENLRMKYKRPVDKLKYRAIEKAPTIRALFKENVEHKVEDLKDINFNLQQNRLNDMLSKCTIEEDIFVLRFLDAKKRASAIESLGSFDDNKYRTLFGNIAEELSVSAEIDLREAMAEIRKNLEKYKLDMLIPKVKPVDSDDEDETFDEEEYD